MSHRLHLRPVVLVLTLLAVAGVFGCSSESDPPTTPQSLPTKSPSRPVLLYNSDGSHLFVGENAIPGKPRIAARRERRSEPLSLEDFLAQVDEVAGKQVSLFLVNPVDYQRVSYRSDIERRIGDGATDADLETATPVLWNRIQTLRNFDRLGIDPFRQLVDRIRLRGMRPMATYRLQAAHVPLKAGNVPLVSSPWADSHPEYRLEYREHAGGEAKWILDFARPEVRARKLSLMRDFMTKYDFEGLELDFQRFPAFVARATPETTSLMSDFVRDVRTMLDEVAKATGRPRIELAARVPETPNRCAELALDPVAWCNEGLLDFLVVSRFLFNNTLEPNLPHLEYDLAAFRQSISRPVPVYGAILHVNLEQAINIPGKKYVHRQLLPDDFRQEAKKIWNQGFDGIELFNFFMLRDGDWGDLPLFLLKELGDPATIGTRTHPEEAEYVKRRR